MAQSIEGSRGGSLSAATDAALVRDCLNGRGDAWETLIRRYRRLVYSIAIAFRLPAADADEVFQRVALKLVENLGKLRSIESLAGWLGTVTRHECQALLREARRGGDPLEDAPEPQAPPDETAAQLLAVEQEHAVLVALERMGEPCRPLLHALYCEQPPPSYGEIGRRLGRPVGSLGPTRARCLKKLQALYLEQGGTPPEP